MIHVFKIPELKLPDTVMKDLTDITTKYNLDINIVSLETYNRIAPPYRPGDVAVAFGGDGTILGAVREMGDTQLPLIGVNFGTLGYRALFNEDTFVEAIDDVLLDSHHIERQFRLAIDVDNSLAHLKKIHESALNDLVLNKGQIARIVKFSIFVQGAFLSSYKADGVIISTPTGSTAYNLSAGGPIVCLDDCFIITPICPMSMSHRPIVIKGDQVIHVYIEDLNGSVYATIDGQESHQMYEETQVKITKSKHDAQIVIPTGYCQFNTLREKLNWGK